MPLHWTILPPSEKQKLLEAAAARKKDWKPLEKDAGKVSAAG